MPAVLPFLPLIIAGATTGTEVGLQASGAFQPSPGEAAQKMQLQNQEANQKSQQQQEQQAFKHFAPDVQAATGGSLSNPSFASMVSELSGAPADLNLAQQTIFGQTPGLSSGSPGGQ